jgi:hypothetical protein
MDKSKNLVNLSVLHIVGPLQTSVSLFQNEEIEIIETAKNVIMKIAVQGPDTSWPTL